MLRAPTKLPGLMAASFQQLNAAFLSQHVNGRGLLPRLKAQSVQSSLCCTAFSRSNISEACHISQRSLDKGSGGIPQAGNFSKQFHSSKLFSAPIIHPTITFSSPFKSTAVPANAYNISPPPPTAQLLTFSHSFSRQALSTTAAASGGGTSSGGTQEQESHTHSIRVIDRPVGVGEVSHQQEEHTADEQEQEQAQVQGAAGRVYEEEVPLRSGAVHLIVGPMFAGKTTELLRRLRIEEGAGRRVVVVKSSIDTRYATAEVVSHDGARAACVPVSTMAEFRASLGEARYQEIDVIGVDEGQFIKDLGEFCREAADFDHKTVYVAGLDGDFLRRKFGDVSDLLPVADSVTKLAARCEVCGGRALFTLRKSSNMATEVVGGAEVYMPVCRVHYVRRDVAMKALRTFMTSHRASMLDAPADSAGEVFANAHTGES